MRWPIQPQRARRYASEMVEIDSVNPALVSGAAGEEGMADWLASTCGALGFEVQRQAVAPGRSNVVARWPGSAEGMRLLLTGHMDTVSLDGMDIEPLKPRVAQGRLYGRGAYDMKGGLAAILEAAAALRQGGFRPHGELLLAFVVDEEHASLGTEALVKEVRPDAAVLAEPTDLDVCIAHKGFAWLTLKAQGCAAHGSAYQEGVDAIAHAGRLLSELETMEQNVFPAQADSLLGRPSAHASFISGGLGLSTYADRCTLHVEHRTLPHQGAGDVLRQWEQAIRRLQACDPAFSASVQLDFQRPGYRIEQGAPVVQALHRAYVEALGQAPTYAGSSGWLDSAILGAAGIPTVIFGPKGGGAHAAVEYVELESISRCAAVLAQMAARWLGN